MKRLLLIVISTSSFFCYNVVGIESIESDGNSNATIYMYYDFIDAVAGYSFDLQSEGVLTITGAEPLATACLDTDGSSR